jgi:hypothetical protein
VQGFLAGAAPGRLLERVERAFETALDDREEQVLLRVEQAEQVGLRDPDASGDRVGGRAVQSTVRELLHRGAQDLLAALLGGEPGLRGGRRHAEEVSSHSLERQDRSRTTVILTRAPEDG